jgi:hypothetical protein
MNHQNFSSSKRHSYQPAARFALAVKPCSGEITTFQYSAMSVNHHYATPVDRYMPLPGKIQELESLMYVLNATSVSELDALRIAGGRKSNVNTIFSFFVIPRLLNFMCRRFETLSQFHLTPPMKMELTDCSETSAHKIPTPGNYPPKIT